MADAKLSKLEHIKENSQQLRGTIQEELLNEDPNFSADSIQLLKHHGTYQQDNRDARKEKNEDGTKKEKQFSRPTNHWKATWLFRLLPIQSFLFHCDITIQTDVHLDVNEKLVASSFS